MEIDAADHRIIALLTADARATYADTGGMTRALQLAMGVSSARSTDRVQLVRGLLAPYRGNGAVDEFEEQAKDLLDR